MKYCSKRSADSDPDSEDEDADRFSRLTSFGSQELGKGARTKSLSEMESFKGSAEHSSKTLLVEGRDL